MSVWWASGKTRKLDLSIYLDFESLSRNLSDSENIFTVAIDRYM